MADEVAKRFAENLARHLDRAGYSQEQLGSLAEVHRTQISELLRARQVPRLPTLIRLAGALEIEPSELLEGIHFEPAEQHGKYKITRSKKS